MKHKNFFMVPNSIFELELKPRELAVYCCLLKYCDEDMTCYPSRSTIGKDCCVDESTVDKALAGLIHKGLVQNLRATMRTAQEIPISIRLQVCLRPIADNFLWGCWNSLYK